MKPRVRSRVLLVVLVALSAGLSVTGTALAQNAPGNTPAATPPDNASLAATVKQDLLRSPDASALSVRVEARDGVITLSGIVVSDVERISAERIARMAAGVKSVENRILVREVQQPVGNGSGLPRTSPTPTTPGAPALPNGVTTPGAPGG